MRLSMQDKNELLKAAVKATSLDQMKTYLASLVDAIDGLPEGKADAPCPAYAEGPVLWGKTPVGPILPVPVDQPPPGVDYLYQGATHDGHRA